MGRVVPRRLWGWSFARRMMACLGCGLMISVVVSQSLGLFNNYDSPYVRRSFDLDWPESPDFGNYEELDIDCHQGLGSRRRAWCFRTLPMERRVFYTALALPRDLDHRWWNIPKAGGPIFTWTPRGDAGWGRLHRTEHLVTESDWEGFSGFEDARGFPALCFWHEIREDAGEFSTPGGWLIAGRQGTPSWKAVHGVRTIAWRPIWAGLVFNTLFYGLIVLACVELVRISARYRRMRMGVCPCCSCDLGGNFSEECSPCGWGVG